MANGKNSKISANDWRYPQPARLRDDFLTVCKTPAHQIYWEEYGNPQGEPVMFLHGGPGGASQASFARFFDPARYRIILYDQRSCGKSKPLASDADPLPALSANTTGDLIGDITKLRKELNITGKMHVFGGSWGSTLALAYAIEHPDTVETLVLRGIFLCRRKDVDYFYQGNAATYKNDPFDTSLPGTYIRFPEPWKKFVEVIPEHKRGDMIKAYAEIFAMTPKTPAEIKQLNDAATAWSVWEGSTSFLAQDLSDLGKYAEPEFAKAFARIENHYFMNGAFLGGKSGEANRDNNYLLDNVHKIAHIPTYIVQGQYDEVCPRFEADELVAALSKAGAKHVDYRVTMAGHSMMDAETNKALCDIMDGLPPMASRPAAAAPAPNKPKQ